MATSGPTSRCWGGPETPDRDHRYQAVGPQPRKSWPHRSCPRSPSVLNRKPARLRYRVRAMMDTANWLETWVCRYPWKPALPQEALGLGPKRKDESQRQRWDAPRWQEVGFAGVINQLQPSKSGIFFPPRTLNGCSYTFDHSSWLSSCAIS